jgi:retron-type reverse transcriptase
MALSPPKNLALKLKVIFCVQGVISPLLANLFMHYTFDMWMARTFPHIPFERYADVRFATAAASRRRGSCGVR